jgi:Acetolactate synthase
MISRALLRAAAATRSAGSVPTGARSPRPFALLRQAKRPLILPAAGCIMPGRASASPPFAAKHRIPVAETIAGRGVLAMSIP